jgi:hypothetical protein
MTYQPFPDGYGYMQENEALMAAVKQGDHVNCPPAWLESLGWHYAARKGTELAGLVYLAQYQSRFCRQSNRSGEYPGKPREKILDYAERQKCHSGQCASTVP